MAFFTEAPFTFLILDIAHGNLEPGRAKCDDSCMPHFPRTQNKIRSPRVRVPNSESIRFNLGGHQVSAVLQKISLTGGLAEFRNNIGSATIAEAKLNTIVGQVSGLVEFLPSCDGTATYPFRFIALSDQDYQRLSSTIKMMQKQGFGT